MLLPRLRSKIPPRQLGEPGAIWPKLISAGLIGHAFPPKDNVTEILVLHAKISSPSGSVLNVSEYYEEERTEGEEASHVGYGSRTRNRCPDGVDVSRRTADERCPSINSRQRRISLGDGYAFALDSHSYHAITMSTCNYTLLDYHHLPCILNSQNVCVDPGMSRNSISPWNKLELVPPRVNVPPGSSSFASGWSRKRVRKKAISGDDSWPPLAKACQNGAARVVAMDENAKPRIPETLPSRSPWVVWSTATIDIGGRG
jgi:hypothetical protein